MLGVKGQVGPCKKCKCKEFGQKKSWNKIYVEMRTRLKKAEGGSNKKRRRMHQAIRKGSRN